MPIIVDVCDKSDEELHEAAMMLRDLMSLVGLKAIIRLFADYSVSVLWCDECGALFDIDTSDYDKHIVRLVCPHAPKEYKEGDRHIHPENEIEF